MYISTLPAWRPAGRAGDPNAGAAWLSLCARCVLGVSGGPVAYLHNKHARFFLGVSAWSVLRVLTQHTKNTRWIQDFRCVPVFHVSQHLRNAQRVQNKSIMIAWLSLCNWYVLGVWVSQSVHNYTTHKENTMTAWHFEGLQRVSWWTNIYTTHRGHTFLCVSAAMCNSGATPEHTH